MITARSLLSNQGVCFENDTISFVSSSFLFLGQLDSAQKQFQHFVGEITLSDEKIDSFQQNIEFNNFYCTKNKIPYVHIVFPAKIPVFSKLFASHGIPVSPIFSEKHKADNVIYPIEILYGEEDFYIQDTHNNDRGRLKLSGYLCNKFGVSVIEKNKIWQQRPIVGDMGARLNRVGSLEQIFQGFEGVSHKIGSYSTANAVKGNSGQIFFSFNPLAPNKKRLLMFGDSFLNTCQSILSRYFEEVIFLRTPFVMPDIADNLAPDFIITSNAERYLASMQNAASKIPYFIHYFAESFSPSKFDNVNRDALLALFAGRGSHEFKKWKRLKTEALLSR